MCRPRWLGEDRPVLPRVNHRVANGRLREHNTVVAFAKEGINDPNDPAHHLVVVGQREAAWCAGFFFASRATGVL